MSIAEKGYWLMAKSFDGGINWKARWYATYDRACEAGAELLDLRDRLRDIEDAEERVSRARTPEEREEAMGTLLRVINGEKLER